MHRNHHALPIMVTVSGVALFSIMDALMKRASIAGGVYGALLVRSLLGFAFMAGVWRLRGWRTPPRAVLRIHALRGTVSAGMASTFFYGLVRTPMAVGIALSFMAPLIALYMAAVLLGEQVRKAAIWASLLALAGVIVIATERIDGAQMQGEAAQGIIAILISAALYAWNLVLQRQQAQLASPVEVAVFQNLWMALALLPLFPWLWSVPHGAEWADIALAAALATAALTMLAWSYARAEAQVLVPIEYTAFIWAALMGWLWFGEKVTPGTIAGVVLIVIGCWIGTRSPKPAHQG